MTTFNLATDPWLPVLTHTGDYTEIGLIEAFRDAELHTLAAGGGLADTAIHRYLLAITYAALGSPTHTNYPTDPSQITSVADWLTANKKHFDLLDPTSPFAQDAALRDSTAPILPPGVLNPMLGKERPRVTDWRSLDDEPYMSYADAARWLLVQLTYSVGGRHKGVSASLPESPLTGLIHFRPAGLLAEQLAWSHIPVPELGEPNWTWRTRDTVGGGVRGSRPTGELDALTWLSRRYLLHHDGTQITGLQQDEGWRRAPEADETAPFDSGAGRHALAVAASSASKPAKAAAIGGRTWRASSGDPIDLSMAWERGGPASLAHHVRQASARTGLTPPHIVATGHQIESKVLWSGQFTTPLPLPDRNVTDRALLITQARLAARTFGNPGDTALLTTRIPDSANADDVLTDLLKPQRRTTRTAEFWPTETTSIWTNVSPTIDLYEGLPEEAREVLMEQAEDDARTSESTVAENLWRSLYRDLHHDDGKRTHLIANATRTRVPTVADFHGLTNIDLSEDSVRLWAGLAATWLTAAGRNAPRNDTATPFPIALRRASAATNSRDGRDATRSLAHTGTTPSALRQPLLKALDLLIRVGYPPSWRSLHHDLTHWTPQMTKNWTNAFWDGITTTTDTSVTD